VRFFSNGQSLNERQQVFAAGHGLALSSLFPGSFMFDHAERIRRLVELRREYKDALIDGRQLYSPTTGHAAVIAYYNAGATHDVVTAVNTSATDDHVAVLVCDESPGQLVPRGQERTTSLATSVDVFGPSQRE
jgi:glycosidase